MWGNSSTTCFAAFAIPCHLRTLCHRMHAVFLDLLRGLLLFVSAASAGPGRQLSNSATHQHPGVIDDGRAEPSASRSTLSPLGRNNDDWMALELADSGICIQTLLRAVLVYCPPIRTRAVGLQWLSFHPIVGQNTPNCQDLAGRFRCTVWHNESEMSRNIFTCPPRPWLAV
jgi:hypothetical protein